MPLLVRGIFMPEIRGFKALCPALKWGIGRANKGPKGEKVGKGG